jgi:hypothetical protein
MKCPGYVHAPDEDRLQGLFAPVAMVSLLSDADSVVLVGWGCAGDC